MSRTNDNKLIGCVKWFNNKSGFGFITVICDCDLKGKDIFAHHSAISVNGDLYKYLVQGEYVEFSVEKMVNKNHESQAIKVTGIMGNELMCEIRDKNRDSSKPKHDFTNAPKKSKH